ncbi:MAG: UbiA family prenyltransferase [Terrimesophilobacter sp.]
MLSRVRHSRPVLLLASSHPGPSFTVAAICVVLGITSHLELWRIATIGLAVLLGQFSVGLSNDWLDADRDRAIGRRDKPVALGYIAATTVRNAAVTSGLVGLAATILVGIPATAAHAVFMAAGWSYNFGLKNTYLSVVPYALGFGALPAIVTLALHTPELPAWWVVAAGAALGVAAHFANALPDLADDRATGIIGLPHLLGSRMSSLVTLAALAAASWFVVFSPGTSLGIVGWSAFCVEAAVVISGTVLVLTRPPGRPLFRLVILGALVAVVSLALVGGQLLG